MTSEAFGASLSRHASIVAPDLLGAHVVSDVGGVRVVLSVNEVEAYGGAEDAASHAANGPTARCRTMFDGAGHLYVYRSYGMHWCSNVVTGAEGSGQAVLIRGGEILQGHDTAVERRGRADHVADGPGKLCQALGINGAHDGVDLLAADSPIRLLPGTPIRIYETTPRIGITKAETVPWRFLAE